MQNCRQEVEWYRFGKGTVLGWEVDQYRVGKCMKWCRIGKCMEWCRVKSQKGVLCMIHMR
jgi:hypothetical protein